MAWTKEQKSKYNKEYNKQHTSKKRDYMHNYYSVHRVELDARANTNRVATLARCREIKGNRCETCGGIGRLDLHHRSPKEKKFHISRGCYITDLLLCELEKCVLMCRSCHTKLHRGAR